MPFTATTGEQRDYCCADISNQIKTAQDISTLIRDLQELWLFGGLDTLADPADEEATRAKALAVAEMIETLAKQGPPDVQKNESRTVKEETNGKDS